MAETEILNDSPKPGGELSDFLALFRDRYERLGRILRLREDFRTAPPIASLAGTLGPVRVVGAVGSKRETSKGHTVLELEDPTGRVTAWVFNGKEELKRTASEILPDEVVGIGGTLREWNARRSIRVEEIARPDLPGARRPARSEEPASAALISDPHVGSEQFVEESFLRFAKWLRGEAGNPDGAEKVKYLVIAGDLVDGIGVYPGQEEELLIHDVYEQYEAAAGLLNRIPERIEIIVAPGNHDAVQSLEPQPAISRSVAPGLHERCTMVGNPALVSLRGVRFLVYHGRSFDDLAAAPGADMNRPEALMVKLLRKRHLAPLYGGKVLVAPTRRDALVIEEVPDVFHCGHAHVLGTERYRGVLAVNSGTFQAGTDFTRRRGIRPTPGTVALVDLQTLQVETRRFLK